MTPDHRLSNKGRTPLNVLVVEDNPDDEELTLRALRRSRSPLRVRVARDGQEALDVLLAAGDDPDFTQLVLLDLKLPKLSGLEVLQRVRECERTSGLPIVVLSSGDEERDLRECYRLHANSYVRKPVDFDRHQEVVRCVADYWAEVNHLPRELCG